MDTIENREQIYKKQLLQAQKELDMVKMEKELLINKNSLLQNKLTDNVKESNNHSMRHIKHTKHTKHSSKHKKHSTSPNKPVEKSFSISSTIENNLDSMQGLDNEIKPISNNNYNHENDINSNINNLLKIE